MSNEPIKCLFVGGTLHGRKQGRLVHGLAGLYPANILEPVYEAGKASPSRKDITHRQVYVRDRKLDADGLLGYRLEKVEAPQ